MVSRRFAWVLLLLLAWCAVQAPVRAQEADTTRTVVPDSTIVPDATIPAPTESGSLPPPLSTTAPVPEGGLSEPIQFSARDSLVLVFDDEAGDLGSLFGNAEVKYTSAQLAAHTIDILFSIDELRARGLPVDTGMVGRPIITQDGETFAGTELAFNMQTERGRIVNATTRFDEGFVRAGVAKVTEDSTLYIKDGVYTTCECIEDPSYSLRSNKMKVVDQKWIYTGPLQLFLFNIPTPLWLPFGFLPAREGRRSGPLTPTYGQDEFGFYLRDWGWYFAMNDYMDLQLQGGLWTRGSLEAKTLFRYRKRYGFDGNVRLTIARFRNGERGDPNFSVRRTGRLQWGHNQEISPTSSFRADVNLSTSSAVFRAVSRDFDDNTRSDVQSTINYSKAWRQAGRSFNISLSQRQQLATDAVTMQLPNLSFSQNARQPFARDSRTPGQGERWYEKVTYSYNMRLNNSYAFTPTDTTDIAWYEALVDIDQYREATGDDEPFDFKTTHSIPLNAAFNVNRVPLLGQVLLNVSPNVRYEEEWFIRTERRGLGADSTLQIESVPGFFALREFSLGVGTNTTIYGIFPVGFGEYQGVRHTLRPSLSFSYTPDFYDESWGYTRSYTDRQGNDVEYPIVQGVGRGLQQNLSFSLSNVFETKRVTADSTGEQRSRVLKLFNLDTSTSYNFAADSLKLSSISLNGRTRLFGQVDLNVSSSFSPYARDSLGRTIDRYVFSLPDVRLARLERVSVTARTSLRSRSQTGRSRPATTSRGGTEPTVPGGANVPGLANSFQRTNVPVDFANPWQLSLDLSYNINKFGTSTTRRATVNASFSFGLTENWQLQGRTGYDFERKELSSTTLNVYRDFACWQMSFNWTPFGAYQSWGFELHVKSGPLADLLRIRQPKSDVRNRFSNFL